MAKTKEQEALEQASAKLEEDKAALKEERAAFERTKDKPVAGKKAKAHRPAANYLNVGGRSIPVYKDKDGKATARPDLRVLSPHEKAAKEDKE